MSKSIWLPLAAFLGFGALALRGSRNAGSAGGGYAPGGDPAAPWGGTSSGTDALPSAPVEPLRAGVPYLFQVRLTSSGDPVGEMAAEDILKSKGASMILFAPAVVPPFWAAGGGTFSTRIASFKATPQGNATVTLGQEFYGIGRLEKVSRLDGQAFNAPGPYDLEAASV